MRISDWSSDVCSSDLFRPQIVGVFTDLSGPAPPGLQFSATIDSRYSSSPTLLKMLAMRSEERRVGKEWSVRVDLGGRSIIKKKKKKTTNRYEITNTTKQHDTKQYWTRRENSDI